MLAKKYSQLIFVTKLLIVTGYLLLLVLDMKYFVIWSQITDLLGGTSFNDRFSAIINLFSDHHPHALRTALIFPIYQMADILGCDVTMLYSIVILFLFIFMHQILVRVLKGLGVSSTFTGLFIILLVFSFLMNGRIAFAMFGNSLILYALFSKTYTPSAMGFFKFIFIILISLWFTSVSSGTFMVALGSIITFYSIQLFVSLPYIKKIYLLLFVSLLILLLSLFPIIFQYINKNLNFYDGSFIHMLDHGIGRYMLNYIYIIGVFIFISPFFLIKIARLLKKYKHFILPTSMIFASLFIGLFGISSLISGLPAYILFVYMIFAKYNTKAVYFV